jgi:hypothetical protein
METNTNNTATEAKPAERPRNRVRGMPHRYPNGRLIMLKHDPFNKNNDKYLAG